MSNEINKKAKELVDKFVALDNDIFCSINYPYSKQCALIDVQNTIDMLDSLLFYDNEQSDLTENIATILLQQKQIKKAIENL
jgi:hypothetical protein